MKKTILGFLGLVLFALLMIGLEKGAIRGEDKNTYITLGTGGVTGIYFPTGGALCRLVNRHKADHGIQCSVESTGGSVYNLNALQRGELDFGISQSDLIYHAYHGTKAVKSVSENKDLRTVVSFYTEPLTIVARKDADIKQLSDLKDKRINIGAPGSGQRATVLGLIDALGWNMKTFKQVSGLNPVEQATALCDNKLDAIIYSVGHPNGSIQEATSSCEANLVDISGPAIDDFVKKSTYYIPAEIPGGLYTGSPDTLKTFGIKVALVTSAKTPNHVVKQVVKSLMDNFDSFKRIHSIFGALTPDSIFKEGVIAPLHPGVEEFLKERNNGTKSTS